jgi:hypothetical protein
MLAAIMIVLIVVNADGTDRHMYGHRDNLEACWAEARKFLKQDPAMLGGVSLGAGCIVSGVKS